MNNRKLKKRIVRFIAAAILLGIELYLLLGPTAWVGESKTNWLTGEGSWTVSDIKEDTAFCQQFVPEYNYLESVSLLFQNQQQELTEGNVQLWIEDSAGDSVWSAEVAYEQLNWGSYTDIKVEQQLNHRREYRMYVNCGIDIDGKPATLSVCSMDYHMPENKVLSYGEEIPDAQLVSRYVYQYAVSEEKQIRIMLICMLTAFGLAVGVPVNKKMRTAVAIILFIATPVILGRQLEFISLRLDTGYLLPNAIRWNIILMYVIEVILLLCFQSFAVSIIITNVFLTFIYTVDYFVRIYRDAPLKWNDISAARTAVNVLEGYDLRPNAIMAFAWMILVMVIVLALQTRVKGNRRGSIKVRLVFFCLGALLLIGSTHVFLNSDFLEQQGFVVIRGFDQHMMYQHNGYLISTCLDIKNSRVKKPEGYSAEQAKEILSRFENGQSENEIITSKEELPHIILIMNESFSDLRSLGNLQISEENMSFFYSLSENTIRGTLNASVLGGGTANSEFEVLMGCSMGLLPGAYYPFQQCIKKPVESIVSELEEQGYSTYSIHPAVDTNWNRDVVYEYLGFDHTYWIEDFEGTEVIHKGPSDRATYLKVQELFEKNRKDEKMFIFDLTIQNHGSYQQEDGLDGVKVVNVDSPEADNFLSLMKESDIAFQELIAYFEKQDENVLICMFGDHQPKFNAGDFYDEIYKQTEGLSEADKVLNRYITPFVIWANYDIIEEDGIDISMNYLGGLLQKTAGLELSPYNEFLLEQMHTYPIITANGYEDANEIFYDWSVGEEKFSEYRIIQYYRLFE